MRLPVFAAVAVCLLNLTAHADTVYNYVGQDFAYVSGPYTTMDKVTGSFTVADPLAADYTGFVRPISFSFSDGVQTINNINTTRTGVFSVTTDANGEILDYDVVVGDPEASPLMRLISQNYPNVGSFGRDFVITRVSAGGNRFYADTAAVNLPGVFTEQGPAAPAPPPSVTPEPSTFALLGTGLLGVAGLVRKRFA